MIGIFLGLFLLLKKQRLWDMDLNKPMPIFIVFGVTKGSEKWVVCAYRNHSDAQAHAKKADEEAKRICGYQGTTYFVEETHLHDIFIG